MTAPPALPPGAPPVPVHAAGRLGILDASSPTRIHRRLRESPPEPGETLRHWFARKDVRRDLGALAPSIDEFWR